MKDHEKRELVSRLVEAARVFANTQQLRSRIQGEVLPAIDAAVAAERERCRLAAHDAVMRALDEAGVRANVLRGMCAEVAMEQFADSLGA